MVTQARRYAVSTFEIRELRSRFMVRTKLCDRVTVSLSEDTKFPVSPFRDITQVTIYLRPYLSLTFTMDTSQAAAARLLSISPLATQLTYAHSDLNTVSQGSVDASPRLQSVLMQFLEQKVMGLEARLDAIEKASIS